MQTKIPNSYYYSDEIFKIESETIFQSDWIYAGLTTDIPEAGNYLTVNVGAKTVIVRKTSESIVALSNVCLHRHNKILTDPKGSGPMLCRYHGWKYSDEGKVQSVPNKASFPDLDTTCLKLKSYKLSVVGKFIFVKINDSSEVSIETFLGEAQEILLNLSTSIGPKVETSKLKFSANWKLVLENTLEGYHLNMVHPNSFVRLGITQNSPCEDRYYSDHSSLTTFSSDKNVLENLSKKYASASFNPQGFFHFSIFPNLLIGSTYGLTFYVGTVDPISPTESNFSYDLFVSSNLAESNLSIGQMLASQAKTFTVDVLMEDKSVVEGVQAGVKSSDDFGYLSNKEKRILHFQDSYMKRMNS